VITNKQTDIRVASKVTLFLRHFAEKSVTEIWYRYRLACVSAFYCSQHFTFFYSAHVTFLT